MRTEESKAATKRYVEAMREVIRTSTENGGRIKNETAFARSIGHSIQNINKLTNGIQDVTPDVYIKSARVHGINPNYVLLNFGNMFLPELIAPIQLTEREVNKKYPKKRLLQNIHSFKKPKKPEKKLMKMVDYRR